MSTKNRKGKSLFCFGLLLLILIPTTISAWDDCLYNKIDCHFPGECSRYVDMGNDKICDRSQLSPEERNNGICISSQPALEEGGCGIINTESENKQLKNMYYLVPISLLLIVFYAITLILSKKKIISAVDHRKIWNILLLVTFLISGILGILLILIINFNLAIAWPFNILFWHVEIGIAMFVISMFHIIERRSYFKIYLRLKSKGKGMGNRGKRMNKENRGQNQGGKFIDADNNGICDNL